MRFVMAFLIALFVAATGASAAEYQEGEHYQRLSESQPTDAEAGAVEVREFFSYGCPHCFDFRPRMDAWAEEMGERVEVVRVPVTFNRQQWELLARAYYVAEALGVLDRTHEALFNAIHVRNQRFGSKEQLADFFASQGVDREEALKAFDSFAVDSSMRRAARFVREYRIMSTPSVGVAGKYAVDVRSAGGQEGMLDVVEYLVEQEAGER